nr:putative disease resistance protein [Quercus suber]
MELHEVEEALPEECLPNLISLRTLSLYNCPLPQSIRYLTALQHLTVWNSEVVDLSNDWDEMEWQGLRNLLSLVVVFLPKLVSLPMGLQYVSSLQILSISHCRSLIAIPEWICKLISLQNLSIWDSPNLESLLEGICALTSLQTLRIWHCPELESLPEGIGDLEEEPDEEAKKSAHKNWDLIKAFGCCNCSTQQLTHWNQLIVQIVEVKEKELKAAGAKPLPNSRRGLHIHGWEIKTRKLSILTSSNLQLWEEKLQISHLPEMVFGEGLILKHVDGGTKIHLNAFDALTGWKQQALCPIEVPVAAKWKFRRQ